MSQQAASRALAMIERAKKRGNATDVSLTRPGTPGGYNPDTGTVDPGTDPTTYSSIGVKIGYRQEDIDNTLIKQGDQQLYVPAKGFIRPVSGERLIVGADSYTVEFPEVVAPGDVDVLYILQIRGL